MYCDGCVVQVAHLVSSRIHIRFFCNAPLPNNGKLQDPDVSLCPVPLLNSSRQTRPISYIIGSCILSFSVVIFSLSFSFLIN